MDYKKSDLNKAKKFLKQRLSVERSIRADIESLLKEYAKKLVAICYKMNIPVKKITFEKNYIIEQVVRKFLDNLEQEIYDDILTSCTSRWEESSSRIEEYLDREIACKTLKSRITEYVSMFEKEVEAMSVACRWSGKSSSEAAVIVAAAIAHPYNMRQFKKAVKEGGFEASRIRTGGYKRGVGQSGLSLTGLKILAAHSISDTWMHFHKEEALDNGAKGFISFRGSSYPCDTCDDYVGYHDIDDYALPLHPHCCCYPVFIY